MVSEKNYSFFEKLYNDDSFDNKLIPLLISYKEEELTKSQLYDDIWRRQDGVSDIDKIKTISSATENDIKVKSELYDFLKSDSSIPPELLADLVKKVTPNNSEFIKTLINDETFPNNLIPNMFDTSIDTEYSNENCDYEESLLEQKRDLYNELSQDKTLPRETIADIISVLKATTW